MKTEKMQEMLKKKGIDAALIVSNVNLIYFTGVVSAGYLYIPAEGNSVLFLRRHSENMTGESIYKPEQIPDILREKGMPMPKTLMLEEDSILASEYLRLAGVFPEAQIKSGAALMRTIRSVKTKDELRIVTETAKVHSELYKTIPSLFHYGMTDAEFSVEVERQARLLGHLGIFRMYGLKMEAYMGCVLAGDNAQYVSPYDFSLGGQGMHPTLPFGPNGTKIEGDMTVMVDVSCNTQGYLTDMTRTYYIGTIPEKVRGAHQASLEIQNELTVLAKPGVTGEELYHAAYEIVKKYALEKHFMGTRHQSKFVGHGLGIEINELPVLASRSKMELQEDMVIALEPKFVFPNVGAVGTENTYIVRKNGLEKITLYDEEMICLQGR